MAGVPPLNSDVARETLGELRRSGRLSLLAASRALGRNDAFLHQFLTRGSPRQLSDVDRLALAQYLRIDERLLGARDPWTPPEE